MLLQDFSKNKLQFGNHRDNSLNLNIKNLIPFMENYRRAGKCQEALRLVCSLFFPSSRIDLACHYNFYLGTYVGFFI